MIIVIMQEAADGGLRQAGFAVTSYLGVAYSGPSGHPRQSRDDGIARACLDDINSRPRHPAKSLTLRMR